ncbi:MAG: rod shape-determining protein [Oscillospiraceae bacterium]|nr:rod shape-determining protein [Oscillospiraceae bacterium]
MSILSKDLGIDLGTTNVVVYAEGKGIVLREPSVVAVDKNTGKILKVGSAARNMLGRTPGNVVAMRPLREGVVSDYELTERMLAEFFHQIFRNAFVKPRVVISVPSGITSIEERAVVQIAQEAGARRVYLIEEPLAAALGSNLSFDGPDGHMIVDIGGGTTDVGVLTMNGIANSASIKVAGDNFDEAIIRYLRKKNGLIIGQTIAEETKITVGTVFERGEPVETLVKGRDFKTGLAREVRVTSADMQEALRRPAKQIVEAILSVLEQTTPELVADIARNGIVLTGGGAQLWGMDKLIAEHTGMHCTVADDADSCVAFGCGKSLSWINRLQEGPINFARRKLLKD